MPTDWANYSSQRTQGFRQTPGGAPELNPDIFRAPKEKTFTGQFSSILGAGTDYANYLTSEETNRYNLSNATLQNAAARFDKPSMTDEDIARQFSGYADKSSIDYSKNLSNLRTTMGGSGVTGGGWAGGQQGRFAAARMASLTDATRSLYEKRIDSDMHDRMDRWLAQQAVAAGQAREPSIVGLDWLGKAMGDVTSKYAIDQQAKAASKASKAASSGGWLDVIGKVAGAAVTAFA